MQKVKEKSNWKGETIVEIEIERLKAFRNPPFQVRDDDDLEKLKESIKMYGILTPLLVRPIKDGTYEIISGHRRKRAAALLGYRCRARPDAGSLRRGAGLGPAVGAVQPLDGLPLLRLPLRE